MNASRSRQRAAPAFNPMQYASYAPPAMPYYNMPQYYNYPAYYPSRPMYTMPAAGSSPSMIDPALSAHYANDGYLLASGMPVGHFAGLGVGVGSELQAFSGFDLPTAEPPLAATAVEEPDKTKQAPPAKPSDNSVSSSKEAAR